jgi:hypothetical protein
MPFIEQAIADAVEGKLLPEGEYDLRISQAEIKDSKKGGGKENIQVVIEFQDEPDAEPIFHYIPLVHPDDEDKTKRFKLRMARRFLAVFGIPFEENGFNTDDFPGAVGNCMVIQQERTEGDGEHRRGTGEFSHALRLPKFQNEPDDDVGREADSGRGRAAATKTSGKGRRR